MSIEKLLETKFKDEFFPFINETTLFSKLQKKGYKVKLKMAEEKGFKSFWLQNPYSPISNIFVIYNKKKKKLGMFINISNKKEVRHLDIIYISDFKIPNSVDLLFNEFRKEDIEFLSERIKDLFYSNYTSPVENIFQKTVKSNKNLEENYPIFNICFAQGIRKVFSSEDHNKFLFHSLKKIIINENIKRKSFSSLSEKQKNNLLITLYKEIMNKYFNSNLYSLDNEFCKEKNRIIYKANESLIENFPLKVSIQMNFLLYGFLKNRYDINEKEYLEHINILNKNFFKIGLSFFSSERGYLFLTTKIRKYLSLYLMEEKEDNDLIFNDILEEIKENLKYLIENNGKRKEIKKNFFRRGL